MNEKALVKKAKCPQRRILTRSQTRIDSVKTIQKGDQKVSPEAIGATPQNECIFYFENKGKVRYSLHMSFRKTQSVVWG